MRISNVGYGPKLLLYPLIDTTGKFIVTGGYNLSVTMKICKKLSISSIFLMKTSSMVIHASKKNNWQTYSAENIFRKNLRENDSIYAATLWCIICQSFW